MFRREEMLMRVESLKPRCDLYASAATMETAPVHDPTDNSLTLAVLELCCTAPYFSGAEENLPT